MRDPLSAPLAKNDRLAHPTRQGSGAGVMVRRKATLIRMQLQQFKTGPSKRCWLCRVATELEAKGAGEESLISNLSAIWKDLGRHGGWLGWWPTGEAATSNRNVLVKDGSSGSFERTREVCLPVPRFLLFLLFTTGLVRCTVSTECEMDHILESPAPLNAMAPPPFSPVPILFVVRGPTAEQYLRQDGRDFVYGRVLLQNSGPRTEYMPG